MVWAFATSVLLICVCVFVVVDISLLAVIRLK